ncbi:MAG: P-II family nitrogen regulator [Planctomycetes bacterium]|nr:P-II family nitrogen regulator [Planctomycetota bacterium]
MLRKIELYLKPSRLNSLQDLLIKRNIDGMSVLEAKGFGLDSKLDKGGKRLIEDRLKVEIVCREEIVDDVIKGIKSLVTKNELGYGKIFVIPVEDAIRVSTREFGEKAVV